MEQQFTPPESDERLRAYSLCSFGHGWTVPNVDIVDADNDAEAIALASRRSPLMMREVWDHHRLVAVIPPAPDESTPAL